MSKLLEIKNLRTYFYTDDGVGKAVDDISLELDRGETLGLVGESGCGKSVTALSVMRLIPEPPGKIVSGEILFKGEDLTKKSEKEMQDVRGNDIAMIFQEPMTSLNPVFTCGSQIDEAVILHQKVSKEEAKSRSIGMLKRVGIPAPEQRYYEYPHQLSGGLRQRVMIAMALCCNPEILFADEPSTALDVTVHAQILDLIRKLQDELGMSVVIITHDLGVIAEISKNVAVMYGGKIVEYSNSEEIFYNPKHPYSLGLLSSIPKLNKGKERLATIEGTVPPATNYPEGCHFCTRCKYVDSELYTPDSKCWNQEPPLVQIDSVSVKHTVACHFWKEVELKKEKTLSQPA